MALSYQTQYSLGRRGGRVCRTYHGVEAVIAIGVDLGLSLIFALVGFALRLAWYVVVTAVRFAFELVQLPLKALRWTLGRYSYQPAPTAKPAWAGANEL
jgi:hypothetical protein